MDLAKLKEEILNEIMEKLDMDEGMKLKPKPAVVAIDVEEKPEAEVMGEEAMSVKPGMEDDEDDEDLKMLLKERMKC